MALYRGTGGVAVNRITYISAGGKTEAIDVPVFAQVRPDGSALGTLTSNGYQQIASAVTATALTVPANTTRALVQNNGTQAMRWRDDGTDPTASIGMRLAPGAELTFEGTLSALKFIQEASGASLDVSYYA